MRGHQEVLETMDKMERLEQQVPAVLLVHLELQVYRVREVLLDQLALLERLVLMDRRELLEILALLDNLGNPGNLVHLVLEVMLVLLATRVLLEM